MIELDGDYIMEAIRYLDPEVSSKTDRRAWWIAVALTSAVVGIGLACSGLQ